MRALHIASLLTALVLGTAAYGQMDKLKVGDPAPAMEIEKWVQGDPVTIAPDRVYVFTFAESQSSPGKGDDGNVKGLAPLFRLAETYGPQGLIVVLIVPENADKVRDSVKQQSQKGTVRIASDQRGSTQRAWVIGAGITQQPVSFIIGKGKIMYIGQPRDAGFDEVLGKVLSGRYDPVLQRKVQPQLEAARRARKIKNWRQAMKGYDEIIALDAQVFAPVAIERFEMVLIDMEDKAGAYGYARETLIAGIFAKDSGALRMLAEKIASDPKLDKLGDLDVALEAAQKAMEIGGPQDVEGLATAALVHFRRGDRAEAIDLQTQAYFLARPEAKAQYKRVLDGYREQAPRASEPAAPR